MCYSHSTSSKSFSISERAVSPEEPEMNRKRKHDVITNLWPETLDKGNLSAPRLLEGIFIQRTKECLLRNNPFPMQEERNTMECCGYIQSELTRTCRSVEIEFVCFRIQKHSEKPDKSFGLRRKCLRSVVAFGLPLEICDKEVHRALGVSCDSCVKCRFAFKYFIQLYNSNTYQHTFILKQFCPQIKVSKWMWGRL